MHSYLKVTCRRVWGSCLGSTPRNSLQTGYTNWCNNGILSNCATTCTYKHPQTCFSCTCPINAKFPCISILSLFNKTVKGTLDFWTICSSTQTAVTMSVPLMAYKCHYCLGIPATFELWMQCHHKTHFLCGFMGLPAGHPHASANSFEFESVPITLNLLGLCTPSTTRDFSAPRVELPHHICEQRNVSYNITLIAKRVVQLVWCEGNSTTSCLCYVTYASVSLLFCVKDWAALDVSNILTPVVNGTGQDRSQHSSVNIVTRL